MREIVEPFVRIVEKHRASPPHLQATARVGGAAFLIVGCTYVAINSRIFFGEDFGPLVTASLGSPSDMPIALDAWFVAAAFGLLYLFVGLRGPRGPRDIMSACWTGILTALFMWALYYRLYLPRDWGEWVAFGNTILRGIYASLGAEAATHCLLSLRGARGNAQAIVQQEVAAQTVNWRAVKRR